MTLGTVATPVSGCEVLSLYIQDMQRLQMETIRTLLPGVRTTGTILGMWCPPAPPKSTIKQFNLRLQVTPLTSTFNRINDFGGVVPT